MALHDKLDQIRNQQLAELLEQQRQQLDLLTRTVARLEATPRGD